MPKRRHVEIKVQQYADGRFGFNHYSTGALQKVRLKRKADAEDRAVDISLLLGNDRADLLGIKEAELARFRQWEAAQSLTRTYGEVVDELAAAKEAETDLHYTYVKALRQRADWFMPAWRDRPLLSIEPGEIAQA